MGASPLRFSVVLARPDWPPPGLAEEALAAWGARPPGGRLVPSGLLAEGLQEQEARSLAGVLRARGVEALPLPEGLLEDLPAPEPASRVELAPEGLILEPGPPPGPLVPWRRLLLVSAAGFRRLERRRVRTVEGPGLIRQALTFALALATGLPSVWSRARLQERTLERSELVYFVELHFASPARRVRIDCQSFDFSCLGRHKVLDLFGNVRGLAGEISRLAPRAALGRGVEILLGPRPLRETGHRGLEDLELEARWRLTLEALKA